MFAVTFFGAFSTALSNLPVQTWGPGMASGDHAAIVALFKDWPRDRRWDSNTGPFVAPSWVADVETSSSSSTLSVGKGTYTYDKARQRWRSKTCMNITMFHDAGDMMCVDELAVNLTGETLLNDNITTGQAPNSVCKAFPTPYHDYLALLALGNHTGSGTVRGEHCEVWSAVLQATGYSLSVRACVGSDGVPRQLNVSTGLAYKALSEQRYAFSNPRVGPVSDAAFIGSDVCANHYPMDPCPAGEEVSLTMYRTHSPAEPASLANRNTGGALGDMAFFCNLGGMDETQVVTKWAVQANSSWGQYGFCLFAGGKNICYGSTGKHVGRQSALGLGEGGVQGQCSANDDVGSWYSFPAEGECQDGAPLGTRGCTWKATPVRSVSARCILRDRGLAESCNRERGHAPMAQSAAIFAAALDSADLDKGGCPDVELSERALMI